MGLSLSINLTAVLKTTDTAYGSLEIAYFGKNYWLRDKLLEFFTSNKENILYNEEDIVTRIPIIYLPNVIELICDEIKSYAHDNITFFEDSTQENEQFIQQMIIELEQLIKINNCLKASKVMSATDLALYAKSLGIDLNERIDYLGKIFGTKEFPVGLTIKTILEHLEDWDIQLTLVNSY